MHTVKSPTLVSIIALTFSALITSLPTIASEHKHDNHHSSQQEMMQLDQGNKWPIDASLHTGMNNIKTALEANIDTIHTKKFTVDQYAVLSNEIKKQLVYLFENCKLPAKADAQLHTLLFKVMQGNEQMKSPNNPRAGAIEIIKALQQYPQYFDDKNWQALKH
jgi:hypothetical protein